MPQRSETIQVYLVLICLIVTSGCTGPADSTGAHQVVSLRRPRSGDVSRPQFLGAQILPHRGMTTFQIQAFLPGKGDIDLLESPSLEAARKIMDGGPEDYIGNKSFSLGGAILLPYANRIRGQLQSDGKSIETTILGKKVRLPANWSGKKPGAEKYAMHGLILASRMDEIKEESTPDQASVTGTLHAGDFSGHWLSKTDVTIQNTLASDSFRLTVTATNVGQERLPMGVGWHPYFRLPSEQREQARLHLPSRMRALVNDYDAVLPTGALAPAAGTPYDFSAPGGNPLGRLFLDDNFVDLQKTPQGHTLAEIRDPAARFGLRITALSPRVSAIQVYAPVEKRFIVLEPQFNWADPFGSVWQGKNTGMVMLEPGQSVTYAVQLELFIP